MAKKLMLVACLMSLCVRAYSQNPQEVAVLQGLLQKYQGCILEKYETSQTARLPVRNDATCMAGNKCSLAYRQSTFAALQVQASRGDVTNFESRLQTIILNDCFQCQKHAKFHTKHVHCTMECGGNNGITQGPCFESCKAGVDITRALAEIGNDIQQQLRNLGLSGPAQGTLAQATGGASVATNRTIINPPDAETCDASPRGYFIAPADLLDWTPTQAPPFKSVYTNYVPPASPTRAQYNPAALLSSNPAVVPNIGANEGRLRADLRQAAAQANPAVSLCKAAAAFALGNSSDGNAFADLSVTGRRSFAAFRRQPPQEAQIVACARSSVHNPSVTEAALTRAVGMALDRAYRVAGLLRAGGWPVACRERSALSPAYIAVSGEDDQPHRPVNVPSAEFPQYDLDVSVPRPGASPLVVHTRYMIAHTMPPAGALPLSCAPAGRTIPADRAPVLAANAEVILYIHGMDSRLEEAMDLTHALIALGRQRGRNYTVISMDLPTSGYADNIDHTTIAPLNNDGHADGGFGGTGLGFAPNKYVVPIVDFDENFIVSFVNTLNRLVPVAQHLKAVVGGSLGGNMTMRLGRPRFDAPWITNVIPWSPAAIWPSFADDATKHAGVAVPWYFAGGDPTIAQETPGARRSFFYGGFDWQSKAIGIIPLGGGEPQAWYWYREGWACKTAHMRLSRIDRYETYNHNFRLWHWRLGMEQLLFSQQINRPGTNQPLYLSNTKRMLLMCGMNDTGGGLCDNTRQVAARMDLTPGFALFLNNTGHSIHNERPNFLARQIADFIATSTTGANVPPPPPALKAMTVHTQSGIQLGTTSWVIVTATDAATHVVLAGKVSITSGSGALVSGSTGQRLVFAGCSRVTGVGGSKIKMAVPCSGRVTASGYAAAAFSAGAGIP